MTMFHHALETASAFESAASRAIGTLSAGNGSIREAMSSAWTAYQEWAEARRATRHLRHLDDRLLRDIGVSRSEINRMVFGPRVDGTTDHDGR
jgi:uncharacterized protein YjiS (DUF1127 family)